MARLIIGHTTSRSMKIWVRGSKRWPVAFIDVFDSRAKQIGETVALELEDDDFYTGVIDWQALRPGNTYDIKVAFGQSTNASVEERVREAYTHSRTTTFPAENSNADMTFMLGSCNLHSLGIVKNPDKVWLRVSDLARDNGASFMIHCGDQIYADIPLPPTASPTFYRNKYLDAWEDCVPMKKLLTELPHYMILDDHEITNNYHRDMGSQNTDYESLQRVAMKVYYEFQHKHNPDNVVTPREYSYTFNHGRNYFFVLDTRTWRDHGRGEMINDEQRVRFERWLLEHRRYNKFVVSSVPFVAPMRDPKQDKWSDPIYSSQRNSIVEFIASNKIGKILFLCGDMHNSYHAKMTIRDSSHTQVIHELMSSPLNQFTPDTDISQVYSPPTTVKVNDNLSYRSQVMASSFYGKHSSVMAVEVSGAKVTYRIYRTRKNKRAAKRGSFSLE